MVRVLILSNSASGRGRGAAVVELVRCALRGAGHDVELLDVRQVRERVERLDEGLARAEVFVIAGGDGTVHHALESCTRARVPVYHLPLGTENLFARHFGMTREDVVRAIEAWSRSRELSCTPQVACDIANNDWGFATAESGIGAVGEPTTDRSKQQSVARGALIEVARPKSLPGRRASACVDVVEATWGLQRRLFAIMASIGPDASVVARLAAVRRGGISHLSYVPAILREMLGAYLPAISVFVDGKEVVHGERGMLVVANSPEYALGVNPARNASMCDGLLDVVFMPAASAVGAGLWLGRCAARMQFEEDSRCEGCRVVCGRSVRVEFERVEGKKMMQLDGECVLVEGGNVVGFEVLPGALKVL